MNLASSSRLSAAAALLTDRPIRNARVPQAIGQSFDWLVPAEAEVLGARVADRPAAFPPAELEQCASASVVDRDIFSRRLRPRERRPQHLMLSEDVQEGTLWAPSPWNLRARKLAVRLCSSCLAIKSLGRDRPRRFILPMTALRVTPISRAVWPQESPAWRQRFSSSMRSEVQVEQFADMLMAARRMMAEMRSLKM